MKVSVTLTETLTYEITKEVEISKEDYKYYLKNGVLPTNDVEHDLSSDVDDEHHILTEHYITDIEKVKQ
jgi:ribosomal protein S16